MCEYGNFSIHIALRDLRPPGIVPDTTAGVISCVSLGTKERKIPMPTSNPMTALFNFVSCPNYTYEVCIYIYAEVAMVMISVGWSVAGVQYNDPVSAW